MNMSSSQQKTGLSKLAAAIAKVKEENKSLRLELASISKQNTQHLNKSHEFSQLLSRNERKLQKLETELRRCKKPANKRSVKATTAKKSAKPVAKKHLPHVEQFRLIESLASTAPAATAPFKVCFGSFRPAEASVEQFNMRLVQLTAELIKVLRTEGEPVASKSSAMPTTDSYSYSSPVPQPFSPDSSVSIRSESSQECRIARLTQEIQENLSRTKVVLKDSYASATHGNTRYLNKYHRGKH